MAYTASWSHLLRSFTDMMTLLLYLFSNKCADYMGTVHMGICTHLLTWRIYVLTWVMHVDVHLYNATNSIKHIIELIRNATVRSANCARARTHAFMTTTSAHAFSNFVWTRDYINTYTYRIGIMLLLGMHSNYILSLNYANINRALPEQKSGRRTCVRARICWHGATTYLNISCSYWWCTATCNAFTHNAS